LAEVGDQRACGAGLNAAASMLGKLTKRFNRELRPGIRGSWPISAKHGRSYKPMDSNYLLIVIRVAIGLS
jgi:hypothetical protein